MVAQVLVVDHPGVFEAETLEIVDGLIHATGHWHRSNTVPESAARSPRKAYTWPARQLREIRWSEGP